MKKDNSKASQPAKKTRKKRSAKKVVAKSPKSAKKAVAKKTRRVSAKPTIRRTAKGRKNNGANGGYYDIKVTKPLLAKKPYTATCNDVIVALQMSHAEGEAFAALWRKAAARMGNGKKGHVALYDAQKVAFYGDSMVRQES